MAGAAPVSHLDQRYSSPEASPTDWGDAASVLQQAEIYWISTVRPEGQPHVTPLIAVWFEGALYFTTGAEERKARNIADNPHCAMTTGNNTQRSLDVVVEGHASQLTDDARLQRIADAYVAKYGEAWRFTVGDGVFHHEAGEALVYEVRPARAFAFARGDTFSQTRWEF